MRRTDGASLKEIIAATDWQAHSVRGFISGSLGKKMGLTVESFKRPDGVRAYRIAKSPHDPSRRRSHRPAAFLVFSSSTMVASLSWTNCSRSWHSPART